MLRAEVRVMSKIMSGIYGNLWANFVMMTGIKLDEIFEQRPPDYVPVESLLLVGGRHIPPIIIDIHTNRHHPRDLFSRAERLLTELILDNNVNPLLNLYEVDAIQVRVFINGELCHQNTELLDRE